jgi:2-keto-3-deoxy-L-fuconate dehydrogenase
MKLDGKVVIITGGASGLGAATGRCFLGEGARVALVDSDAGLLEQTAASMEGGARVRSLVADVTDAEAARTGVAAIVDSWGGVDVIVTAAGISPGGTVATIDEAAWDRVFAVNVKGTYLWVRQALIPMTAARRGSIILFGSQLAVSSRGNNAGYIASKGAIVSLTRTMAVDHAADNIRVNALMPGAIDTPMPARSLSRYPDPEAMRASWAARHPLNRFGTPEEVAKAALFLASDDSSFTTGSLLFVDGGWTAM